MWNVIQTCTLKQELNYCQQIKIKTYLLISSKVMELVFILSDYPNFFYLLKRLVKSGIFHKNINLSISVYIWMQIQIYIQITCRGESAARGRFKLSECFQFPHVNISFLGDNNSSSVDSETHTGALCGEMPLGLQTHSRGIFMTGLLGQ